MAKQELHEARRALMAIRLEVPRVIADDLNRRIENAFFALSWQRMVLLAVYAGPSHLLTERLNQAMVAMQDGPKQVRDGEENG